MNKTKVVWLPFILVFAFPWALAQRPAAADSALAGAVDSYVDAYVQGNNFGGAILIAKGGKVLLSKGYGLANHELGVANTADTRFHIASLSKTFTAAAILILQERGQLSVEDPLSKFIPDYPNGEKITVHQLLTHTSGIPNVNDLPGYDERARSPQSLNEIILMFKNKPLEFVPGARYRYSNSNYNLLAFILEKVSGKSYGAFLKENIFQPLGMNETGNDDGSNVLIMKRASGYVPAGMRDIDNAPYLNWSAKTGNGSLYSTVGDLYKWDRSLYTHKILTQSSLTKMFTDYGGFGYGWRVRKHFDRRVVVMTGRSPGFTSSLERFIDDDVCIIVAGNTYSGLTQSLADDLSSIVFGQKYEVPRPPANLSAASLESYAGRYQFGQDFVYNPGIVATVVKRGNALVMLTAGGDTYLIPESETAFVDRLFGGVVTFTKDSNGAVRQLTWNFGKDFIAERLK